MRGAVMTKGRWWVLGALAVALLTFGLDTTILNVALPVLATDLHASSSQLQWFANAYTLVLAAGVVALALLAPSIPGRSWQRIDHVGIVLSSAGLVGVTYGLIQAGDNGWASADVLLPIAGGVVLLVALALWLRRTTFPLFDLGLF